MRPRLAPLRRPPLPLPRRSISSISSPFTDTIPSPPLSPTPATLLTSTLADLFSTSRTPTPPLPSPTTLPFGHHHAYFPTKVPPSGMLPDGAEPHYVPVAFPHHVPVAFPHPPPKRLWAGGSIHTSPLARERLRIPGTDPLVCIETASPSTASRSVGGHAAIDIWRRYGLRAHLQNHGTLAWQDTLIWERRTLIFIPQQDAGNNNTGTNDTPSLKDSNSPAPPPPRRARPHDSSVTVTPSLMHLFNFSALTYNSHRIHYDAEYARSEGHRGVLVHGPLSMILLAAVAQMEGLPGRPATNGGQAGDGNAGEHVRGIEYRNLAPLYAGEPLTICARWGHRQAEGQTYGEHTMWIEGADGRLAVKATLFTAVDAQHPHEDGLRARLTQA